MVDKRQLFINSIITITPAGPWWVDNLPGVTLRVCLAPSWKFLRLALPPYQALQPQTTLSPQND